MRFKDKVVLITGGCSGIGRAAAMLFAKEGAKIMLADLSEKAGDETVEEIEKLGGDASFMRVNVTDNEDVERLISETILRMGNLHILVNAAGILGPRIRTDKYPVDDFQKVMDVNVTGLWYCTKAALQHFVSNKSGVIVNIASVAGMVGMTGHIGYSASKHAVLGMTKTTALEFAKHGIRVNAVCPGFTVTPMLETAQVDDAYLETLQNATPMKRFGQPNEIATAILYLASDESSFMTGNSIVLDGGLTVQ